MQFDPQNLAQQAAGNAPNRIHKGLGNLNTLAQGWQILAEQLSLPAATLKRSAIEQNLQWMQSFADSAHVQLAPHGKTSMAPALFQAQIASGAWGMSVANAQQIVSAHHAGVQNIILANQLVGLHNFAIVANVLRQHQGQLYVFADSLANLGAINDFCAAKPQRQCVNRAGGDRWSLRSSSAPASSPISRFYRAIIGAKLGRNRLL